MPFTLPAWALSLLANPKLWAALGVGCVLALAGVQTLRLDHAKADLAAARGALVDPATKKNWQIEAEASAADLASCHVSLSSANAALSTQDAAVQALKTESDQRTAAATAALKAASSAAQVANGRAAVVLAAKPIGDACKGADALILGEPQLKFRTIFACLLLEGCATIHPEPQVVTRAVTVPVAIGCAPSLPARPDYPDTDEALKAAPDIYARVRLLVAGRIMRMAREGELDAALGACAGGLSIESAP